RFTRTSCSLRHRRAPAVEVVGHLDVDLQRRHLIAAVEPHDDLGRIELHMPGDNGENFLTQHAEQIRLAAHSPFMPKQDLQALASDGCSRLFAAEKPEQAHAHAALLRSNRSMKPFRSAGTTIETFSPHSRFAASI